VFPRARYHDGRAGSCVWFNAPSIAIELDTRRQPWSLLVVSTRNPTRRRQPSDEPDPPEAGDGNMGNPTTATVPSGGHGASGPVPVSGA
jgi:hypothetical protein